MSTRSPWRSPLLAWLLLAAGCVSDHAVSPRPDAGTTGPSPRDAADHARDPLDAGDADAAGDSTSSARASADAGTIAMPLPPQDEPRQAFDAGRDPDRNAVTAGSICDRLATLQCAGEAACCDAPGRSQAECNRAMKASCDMDAMADAVADRAEAAFDADGAERVFSELERLMRACDPDVVTYGASLDGLRSLFAGTVEADGDCTPDSPLDTIMGGAALVACKERDSQACMPTVGRWTCTPRAENGGDCFSDDNCEPGLYCDNPTLSVRGSTCKEPKASGSACQLATECASLFCDGGVCVTADVQLAYCLREDG